MKLECTKKLLDYLGIKPEKTTSESSFDPIFSWAANLITLNRRKTLVVVNLASRCMFVLHGITIKNIPKLPELIFEGIRTLLKSEYVRPEIIEKYLDDCGRSVTYVPNSSRSVAAVCTKACERADSFSELLAANDMFQQKLLPWLNNDLVPKENYEYTYNVLLGGLRRQYGENVQACRAAELEVELELDTPCKRTLIVPADLNFYQLHRVLQETFEWHDCHLHQFMLESDRCGRPVKIIPPPDDEPYDFYELPHIDCLDSLEAKVDTVMEAYRKIKYEYDFGDGWIHNIKLKRIIEDCTLPYPHCTEAIGDAPMEDCGGPGGFAEVMKIMNDPEHPDHEEICAWVQDSWWHPVDLELINRRIENEYRICMPVCYE